MVKTRASRGERRVAAWAAVPVCRAVLQACTLQAQPEARPATRRLPEVCSAAPPTRNVLPHPMCTASPDVYCPLRRYTWLAARCEPWSPARHAQFPLRFKAAMRQLLLVHHRSEQGDGGGGAQRAQQLAARGAKRACVASPVPQAQQQRVTRSMRSGKAGRGAASKQPPKQPRGVAKRRGLKSGGAEPPRRHGVRGSAAGAASGRSTRSGGGGGGGTAVEPAVVAAEAPRAATALQAARGPPVAGPSSLPPELLLHIIGKAAFPVSAWL